MLLGGHVLIERTKGKNKKSVSNLFEKSNAAVQSGIPMFLFPQGTRDMSERLPFKDGAFIIAQSNKSPLIPISIDIPMNVWNNWFPFIRSDIPEVVVTVHKPIEVTGAEDREELRKRCFDQIYSCLPKIWVNEEQDRKSR
jgi:1-acyl-sn-glycerol-3-phosphate acyltransferase